MLNNTSPKNNVDYTNTNKVMAFDVVGDAFDTRQQLGAGNGAQPAKNDIMELTPAMSVANRNAAPRAHATARGR